MLLIEKFFIKMEYRLNKYISASGFCSRREADRFIEKGKVTIDGKIATVKDKVLPGQKVMVSGTIIEAEIKPVYIAFNKPTGIISTANKHERNNIVDFIKHEQRIYPIDNLEKEAQGLILLTNDSSIVKRIEKATHCYKKVYIVSVNKPITPTFITEMSEGVAILGQVTRKCDIKQINPYTFQITIVQELNRQVSRMCEHLGYEVVKLECTQIMNINLNKLGQGNWRDLTKNELEGIFDMLDNAGKVSAPQRLVSKKNTSIRVKSTQKKQYSPSKEQPENKGQKENSENKDNKRNNKPANKPKSNILKGPREGKSKVKAIKDKARKRY